MGGSNHTWIPLPKIKLGDVDFKNASLSNFHLPPSVPPTARKVLYFIYVRSGFNAEAEGPLTFRIYSRGESGVEYSHYLFGYHYPQNSWSFSSDNIWLPHGADHSIYIHREGAAQDNVVGEYFCYRLQKLINT
eukprot:Phypoly_transcript_24408.p1 GENE.Phypoly_transcript_24408~~Phypoly_transcript_24408.p1  ORF type:complete len:133 (+),score=7.67 Phypoly_transcript_24408:114-512(+)